MEGGILVQQRPCSPKAIRITDSINRPDPVTISVDDRTIGAYAGESLATALLAAGIDRFRTTSTGAARGPYCNMGVCFDCVVTVVGKGTARACSTPVTDGMQVTTDGR